MRLIEATCSEASELLSEHLEGTLRGLRRLRVARHLARCELCGHVLASLARTVERLRALGAVEPPLSPSVAEAVLVRLRGASEGFR